MIPNRVIPVRISHEEITSTHEIFTHVCDLLEYLGGRYFMEGDETNAERCKNALKAMHERKIF